VAPKIIEQVEAADDDELKEALLQSLETFLYRCPREMAAYQDKVLKIVTTDLTYDPNYSYSDDEEEQSMEIGDGDTDEDDAEDYSDDDDMSWKVRRASAKTIEAMIVSRRDQLSNSVQTLGPLLISRLREREENVRIDIYNAYIAILSQARLVVPNALAAVYKDEGEEPIKIGTTLFSPSALSEQLSQQLLQHCRTQSEPLLKAVMKQLRTLPGSLASYLPSLLPGLSNAVLDRNSGAPMKIDALSLLARVIKCHDHSVSAEGLSVASHLVPEVKERAIYAAGLFIATFADDMPSMVPTTLELMVERLRNEMTRLYAVRALIMIAESRDPLVDISPIVPFLLPTFTDFLKKNSRALRIGTLHLIEALLLRDDIPVLDTEDLTLIFAELPPLIRESDLQISQLCLKCITVGLQAYPDRVAPQLASILSSVIHLSQSALLQGATLQASLDMIQVLVSNPVPGKPEFEELLDQLTAPVYDVPNLSRQAFQSISAATGVVAAASGDIEKARSLAESFRRITIERFYRLPYVLFSVHVLWNLVAPSLSKPEKLIIPTFNSSSEDLKAAAAQALGALAVGGIDWRLAYFI
ncbi:hypothetical protein OSTOST_17416, partial [Ostertagia ostertagi]